MLIMGILVDTVQHLQEFLVGHNMTLEVFAPVPVDGTNTFHALGAHQVVKIIGPPF